MCQIFFLLFYYFVPSTILSQILTESTAGWGEERNPSWWLPTDVHLDAEAIMIEERDEERVTERVKREQEIGED